MSSSDAAAEAEQATEAGSAAVVLEEAKEPTRAPKKRPTEYTAVVMPSQRKRGQVRHEKESFEAMALRLSGNQAVSGGQ